MNQFVLISQNKNDKIKYLLSIIDNSPGIRYVELLRMTGFNNGVLSYYLRKLDKDSLIKVLRNRNTNTSRYYSNSLSSESMIILGYLRSAITRDIIMNLMDMKCSTFCDLTILINKCPSTTSWYLKKLLNNNIITKKKKNRISIYFLQNPSVVDKLIKQFRIVSICANSPYYYPYFEYQKIKSIHK